MIDNGSRQRKQIVLLSSLAIGMFGFAFALAPLYDIFCEITGINGRTASTVATSPVSADQISDREVTIQFLAKVGRGMPWEFRPTEQQMKVRLGETNLTAYYARNHASQGSTGQAVPSISPGYAARHLRKIECFCFARQYLDAGGEQEMFVRFYIDEDLPEEVKTLTLSYTLYEAPDAEVASPELASID